MEREVLGRLEDCNGNVLFENVRETYDMTRIYGLYLDFSTGECGWADFENNRLTQEKKTCYSEKLIENYLREVIVNSHYNCACKYAVYKNDEVIREGGYLFSSKD